MTGVLRSALLFAVGVVLFEGGSSLVHALVLKDIPPQLVAQGVDLWWMLERDVLLGVLGGAFFALGALLPPRRGGVQGAATSFVLGVVFALLIELLNWIIPSSLLSPVTVVQGVVAWTCFVVGAFAAARWRSARPVTA